jgi:hypothetical protein
MRNLILAIFIFLLPHQTFAAYNVWLADSLLKYRQGGEDAINGSQSLTIGVAQNEFESFQVLIYADGETLTDVDVVVSDLVSGINTIDDIYLYKQHYLDIPAPSVLGTTADWEDTGNNVWRRVVADMSEITTSQDVLFYSGGLADTNIHTQHRTSSPDRRGYWFNDETYLYVFAESNPATYYTEIVAPNRRSKAEYEPGAWPDALLPKVDRYFGEVRNTFPFDVADGNVQGVWVDVGTETTTPPGTYTGTVTVSATGKSDVVLPITVEVFDFALPSTSNFKSKFIFAISFATYGHGYGQNVAWMGEQVSIDLAQTYLKSFLYHKMGIALTGGKPMFGPSQMTWDSVGKVFTVTSFEPWETIVSPTYDGTAITTGPYAGAKAPTVIPYHGWPADAASRTDIAIADKSIAQQQYTQQTWDKFVAEGWDPMERMYWGTLDEPRCTENRTWRGVSKNMCDIVIEQAQEIYTGIDTGGLGAYRNTYTNSALRVGLEDFATYGFHSANTYRYVCPGWDRACSVGGTKVPRDTYPGYPDEQMWAYLACDNNGCWQTGRSHSTGQIDWSADAPALYNRFPGFVWAKYEAQGTIFWQTVGANYYYKNIPQAGDPFRSIWYFGSNGDGTLIYPGVASDVGRTTLAANTPIIGGTNDIPIESIRMKHIRDAIEDWEYYQLAKMVNAELALDTLNTAFLVPNIEDAYWNLNMMPSNFSSTRWGLASIVSGAEIPAPPDPVCSPISRHLCGVSDCETDGAGYWYNDQCNATPEPTCGPTRRDLCVESRLRDNWRRLLVQRYLQRLTATRRITHRDEP